MIYNYMVFVCKQNTKNTKKHQRKALKEHRKHQTNVLLLLVNLGAKHRGILKERRASAGGKPEARGKLQTTRGTDLGVA